MPMTKLSLFTSLLLCFSCCAQAQKSSLEEYLLRLRKQVPEEVKVLQLSGMELSYFPQELCIYTAVEEIYLDKNLFVEIPVEISVFAHLRKLTIRQNVLQGTVLNLSRWKELKYFDAGLNRLGPKLTIRCARKMERVVLDGMGLKSVYFKGKQPSKLDLSGNRLEALQQTFWRKSHLEVLVLHSNALQRLPNGVKRNRKLKKLVLGNNDFEEIPEELKRLRSLESLMFYKNRLTALPPFVWEMKQLTEIDIHHNKVLVLDSGIGNLVNLTELYAANNCLLSLPPEIGQLRNLRYLYIEKNELSALPNSITELHQLERLSLLGNRFFIYPAPLIRMHWIEELDISENDIEQFPDDFGAWPRLRLLLLHENACKEGMSCMFGLESLADQLQEKEVRLGY